MNKRSIIINSLAPNGDKLQKTLTDVNPAATPTQITTFTRALNGLTNNSYASTQSIDRDVVMSTTPDTKIPTCYIRRLDAWGGNDEIQDTTNCPKILSGTVINWDDFNTFFITEYGETLFCTASDAAPYVSKLPDDAALVLTDVTDWIRAKTACMTTYSDETTVAALSTKSHVAEFIAGLYEEGEYSDDQIARINQEISDTLFELKFWRINCIATKGYEHGGEYIISLPATAKYSATNFSFTVTPQE